MTFAKLGFYTFIIKDGGQNGIEYHGVYPKFIAILPTLQSQDGGQNGINMIGFLSEIYRHFTHPTQ